MDCFESGFRWHVAVARLRTTGRSYLPTKAPLNVLALACQSRRFPVKAGVANNPDASLMKMKLSLPTLAACAVGLVLLTGCGKSDSGGGGAQKPADAPAAGKKSIALIPKGTTHVFWKAVDAGARKAGEEMGYTIVMNAPERETDRERQIQIVEDFIAQKADAIVLAPLDRDALVPSVEKLAKLKVPCVIIDSAIGTDNYVCFAATDNYLGGTMAARRMGATLGGKGKIIVIKYAPGSASTTERENGFMDTIKKEFPGIEIVDAVYGHDTVETALQATEDLLTRHPDLQGVFACNASTAVGAYQALQSQKRSQVKFIGFDAEKAVVDGLRAGQVDALVVQNPFKMGYEGVKAAVASIKGEPVTKRIDTGCELITKDRMEEPAIKELLKNQ